MAKKLQARRVYDVPSRNYFGWDLRATEWVCVVWHRSPRLENYPDEVVNWPYRLETAADYAPDFSIAVQGDPSDELLTAWLVEEEQQAELSCVAS